LGYSSIHKRKGPSYYGFIVVKKSIPISKAYLILTPTLVPKAAQRIVGVQENQEFAIQIKPFFKKWQHNLQTKLIFIYVLISF